MTLDLRTYSWNRSTERSSDTVYFKYILNAAQVQLYWSYPVAVWLLNLTVGLNLTLVGLSLQPRLPSFRRNNDLGKPSEVTIP